MDQTLSTIIAAAVPTLAVIGAFIRNESTLASLGRHNLETSRIDNLEHRMDARFEMLERRIDKLDAELRDWAKIRMHHNTDIARLKDKAGLE